MSHYSTFESNEPKFIEYESYHLNWNGNFYGYGNGGPYGEPIVPYRDDFFHEHSSPAYPEEAGFIKRFWHGYGLSDEELQLQLPHYGDNNWLGENGFYFDGPWKYDTSYGYGVFDNGSQLPQDSLEKAQDTYIGEEQYEDHCSYNDDRENSPASDYNSWLGFLLEYGVDEEGAPEEYEPSHNLYGPSHGHTAYDMRLCDMIFGYWPPLSTMDQESSVAEVDA